jgi:hypothetical protein
MDEEFDHTTLFIELVLAAKAFNSRDQFCLRDWLGKMSVATDSLASRGIFDQGIRRESHNGKRSGRLLAFVRAHGIR